MYLQPAFTMPQELLDFVITYPIVLIVIQNWHEHIEVGQQLAQAAGSLKRDCKIRTHPPFRALFVQGVAGYHQRIAQRFKKALEKAFTAMTRYNRKCCLQRNPGLGQLRPTGAASVESCAQNFRNCHAQKRGRHIGTIIDILFQCNRTVSAATRCKESMSSSSAAVHRSLLA